MATHGEDPFKSVSASPEYRTFKRCYEFVVATIKLALGLFCDQLFSKSYISEDDRDFISTDKLPSDKARRLANAVSDRIKQDPSVFHSFLELEIVNDPSRNDFVRTLRECLEDERNLNSTGASNTTTENSNREQSQQEHCLSPMEEFNKELKTDYRERIYLPDGQWPPVKREKLINLQLVEFQKNQGSPGHLGQNKRTPIACSELFSVQQPGGKPIRRILVEGNAGMGKTTLCTMLTEKWADAKSLEQFKCVLLLPLRETKVSKANSLEDLFKLFHPDEDIYRPALKEITRSRGRDVLLIADGWDELSEANRSKDSFLYELLFGRTLPRASVLITSRSSASAPLHDTVDRLVEVVGFSKEEIHEFIESEFVDDPDSGGQLIQELERKPHIRSSCSTPLTCAIICFLWRFTKEIPSTRTKLYELTTRSKIYRELTKRCPDLGITSLDSFDSIPQPFNKCFWDACKFAYDGLCNDKIVFREDKLPESLCDSFLVFGLMQSSRSLLPVGYEVTYQFVHLAIQEFLAALFFSTLSSIEKIRFFNLQCNNRRFDLMLTFAFGLSSSLCSQQIIQFDNEVLDEFVRSYPTEGFLDLRAVLLNCVVECDVLTNKVAVALKDKSSYFASCMFSFEGMCKVLSNRSSVSGNRLLHMICITSCNLEDSQFDMFTNALVKCPVKMLGLADNHLTSDSLSDLFTRAGPSLQYMTDLAVDENPLKVSGFQSLTLAIDSGLLPHIERLSLGNTLTEDPDINGTLLALLFTAIASNCSEFNTIRIQDNILGASGMSAVVESFSSLATCFTHTVWVDIDAEAIHALRSIQCAPESGKCFGIAISYTTVNYKCLCDITEVIRNGVMPIKELKIITGKLDFSDYCYDPSQTLSTQCSSVLTHLSIPGDGFSGDRVVILTQLIIACHKSLVCLETSAYFRDDSPYAYDLDPVISVLRSSGVCCEVLEEWDASGWHSEQLSQHLSVVFPCLSYISHLSVKRYTDMRVQRYLCSNNIKNDLRHSAAKRTSPVIANRDWMIMVPNTDDHQGREQFFGLWKLFLELFICKLSGDEWNFGLEILTLASLINRLRVKSKKLKFLLPTLSPGGRSLDSDISEVSSSSELEAEAGQSSSRDHPPSSPSADVHCSSPVSDHEMSLSPSLESNHSTDQINTSRHEAAVIHDQEHPELSANVLSNELEILTKPKQFGILLGIPVSRLEIIERDHPLDTEGQKAALFCFIEKNYRSLEITWSKITEALDKMSYKDLSLDLQEKYCTVKKIKLSV